MDVGRPRHQRIMEELHGADLQHVQNDLSVLRVILVPAVMQAPRVPGQANGRHKLHVEAGLTEMTSQNAVVIASRLKPDPYRKFVAGRRGDETLEVIKRVQDRHAASALLARDANQHLAPMFGDIDGDEQGGRGRIIAGYSRPPQQCGFAKPLLRPETGYGHALRYVLAARVAITSRQRFFPTCYSHAHTDVSGLLMQWAEKRGFVIEYISPDKPLQKPITSATTPQCGTSGLIKTSLKRDRRLTIRPQNGSGLTSTTGPIWPSAGTRPL